jgi:hypothetical protein
MTRTTEKIIGKIKFVGCTVTERKTAMTRETGEMKLTTNTGILSIDYELGIRPTNECVSTITTELVRPLYYSP